MTASLGRLSPSRAAVAGRPAGQGKAREAGQGGGGERVGAAAFEVQAGQHTVLTMLRAVLSTHTFLIKNAQSSNV